MRLQSAMEYLMTYGWAILIIAVVMVGLWYSGVFNSETFAPKASPGACYVLRTAAEVSLAGECNNYIPRSVAQFNGASSYISTGTSLLPGGSTAYSVFAWVYYAGNGDYLVYSYGYSSGDTNIDLEIDTNLLVIPATSVSTLGVPANAWSFIGYTTTGSGSATLYVNGQSYTHTTGSALQTVTGSSTIGKQSGGTPYYFPGEIANLQIYNTSLSASTIQTMYAEGIGGAPIQLQNLVAWWPLNGDAVDYSGNGNNGVNNNVVFNPNWYTSYVPT